MFATPLDTRTVMVRTAPETHLWVWETDTPGKVAVYVDLRGSQPPLLPREVDALRPFFDWPEGRKAHDWFATVQPAFFHLLRVRDGVFIGFLEHRGRVGGLPGSPSITPRSQDEDFRPFRAYRREEAAAVLPGTVRDFQLREAAREPEPVYRAAAVVGWLAEIPEYGPGRVWLRTCDNATDPEVFAREAQLLRLLADHRPGAAVRIAHRGTLEDRPYLATSPPLGAGLEEAFGTAARPVGARAVAAGWELAADLLLTLAVAHRHGLCVGGISPALLRVRSSFVVRPPIVRAMLLAAPLAGPTGEPVRQQDLALLPLAPGSSWTPPAPGEPRSPAADVAGVGRLLNWVLKGTGPEAAGLRTEASALAAGAVHSAAEALERLSAGWPALRDHVLGALRPRSARSG